MQATTKRWMRLTWATAAIAALLVLTMSPLGAQVGQAGTAPQQAAAPRPAGGEANLILPDLSRV
jgi:hypothetical protein